MAADTSYNNSFADHYGFLGGDPDQPLEELKKLYHEKLREYHPDKRPESAGGTGQRVTQSLNEAWEVLRDPQRKEAYDITWRREKESRMPPHERADLHRRKGNDLYGKARELGKDSGTVMNLAAVHQSMKMYKNAMEEYSIAMESAPNDHRLYSNRALCYLAVEDWVKARDDAQYCARLRPDFKKAWLLLTKALWKMNRLEEASDQLQQGLLYLPGCAELLELQQDFSKEVGERSFRTMASRSVSPVYTPTPSRSQTPTRGVANSSMGPGQRPVSPRLVAAGGLAAQTRNPANAQTYAGPSRSPGPSSRSPGPSQNRGSKSAPNLDASSASFHTGNFGAPTPVFAAGSKMTPTPDLMGASFPASAQTMWAGPNPGNASHRSSYSPGPASAGPGTARTSHSPGPSFGPGPDLGASTDPRSPGLPPGRRTGSLKGMLESSSRSRGNTPPRPPPPPGKGSFTPPRGGAASRGNTPPPPPPPPS